MTRAVYSNIARRAYPTPAPRMTGRFLSQLRPAICAEGHLNPPQAQPRPVQSSDQPEQRRTLLAALSMPGLADIEFDPPRLDLVFQHSVVR